MADFITIHADGSCLGNPGPGGWAILVDHTDALLSGSHHDTTNNRMELRAALEAFRWGIRFARKGDSIVLKMDSQYALRSIFEWMPGWRKKGWKNASGNPVANLDLIQELDEALHAAQLAGLSFSPLWVKGHAGDAGNEAVDCEARLQAENAQALASMTPDTAAIAIPASAGQAYKEGDQRVIRLRRDLSGRASGFDLAEWQGSQIAVRRSACGIWRAMIPIDCPDFTDAMVEVVLSMRGAQA